MYANQVNRTEVTRIAREWHNEQATHPGYLSWANYLSLGAPVSSSNTQVFASSLPETSIRLDTWAQAVQVVTTNNSSNYWQVILRLTDANSATSDVGLIDTRKATVSTWYKQHITIYRWTAATDILLRIYAVKVGSPGSLYLAGPNLSFSL